MIRLTSWDYKEGDFIVLKDGKHAGKVGYIIGVLPYGECNFNYCIKVSDKESVTANAGSMRIATTKEALEWERLQ